MLGFGNIRQNSQCLDSNGRTANGHMTIRQCVGQDYVNQEWRMSKAGVINFSDGHGSHWCLSLDALHQTVLLVCDNTANQIWEYNTVSQGLIHRSSGLCLDSTIADPVLAVSCNLGPTQIWHFTNWCCLLNSYDLLKIFVIYGLCM